MMKRIFMLLALALMLVAAMALSGVAQAASPTVRCQQEAETLTGLDLTGYNVVVGNNKRADYFTSKATAGGDVFCGRGGNDQIDTLDAGDIFIGGAGDDTIGGPCTDLGGVNCTNSGTFYGGDGRDVVYLNDGTFYGGGGGDFIVYVAWSTNPIIL